MILELFVIWLLLAFSIFGYFSVNQRKYPDISKFGLLFGTFMIFFAGLIVLVEGVSYKIGSSIISSGNLTNITYNYGALRGGTGSYGFSIGLILLSIGLFFWIYMTNKQDSDEEVSEPG